MCPLQVAGVGPPVVANARSPHARMLHAAGIVTIIAWMFLCGTPASGAAQYQMNTGSYSGDGNASQPVNGLGFRPDVVIVRSELADATVVKTSTMGGALAKPLGTAAALSPDLVVAFSGDGFTAGANLNNLGQTYYWVAFEAAAANLAVGSYLGTGSNSTSIPVGLRPTYVWVMSEAGDEAAHRFGQQPFDECLPFGNGVAFADGIQLFNSSGFQVGLDARVNTFGVTYHYLAWADTPAIVSDGSYVGNGGGNRKLAVGIRPRAMLVGSASISQPAIERTDAMPVDASYSVDGSGGSLNDGIRAFNLDGFDVGGNAAVNGNLDTYYWVVFNSPMDLEVSGVVDNATPSKGDTLSYTWTLTNHGPDVATGVNVVASLPPGLSLHANSPSQGTYNAGSWSAGNVTAGASATLTIDAVVGNAQLGSTISNAAYVGSSSGAGDISAVNDSFAVDVTVVGRVDLSLSKSVDDPSPAERDTIQFMISLVNNGPDDASQVQVFDRLPSGLTYVGDAPSAGSYSSASGFWTIGDLINGASATLLLDAVADLGAGGTTLTNKATASALENDSFQSDNADSVDVDVGFVIVPLATDLSVLKGIDNLTPNEGDSITYTIALRNNGPNPASGVQVRDPLPAEVAYQGHNAGRGSYDPGSGLWSVGDLPADSAAVLSLDVSIPTGSGADAITNAAWVSALDQTDADSANDTSRVVIRTMEVQALPVGAADVLPGATNVMLSILQMTNHALGANDLTGLVFEVASPISQLRLWLDDGDLVFSAADDSLLSNGASSAGRWSVSGLDVTTPTEDPIVLFLTGDVSLLASPHGTALTATLQDPSELTWSNPAAVVSNLGFPLGSPSAVRVADLALAQLGLTSPASASVAQGAVSVPVLEIGVPDDGGLSDRLARFELQQVGSAIAATDIARLRLLELAVANQDTTGPGPGPGPGRQPDPPNPEDIPTMPKSHARVWKPVELGEFFHIGAGRWSTNGLDLAVPAGGTSLQVVVDIATDARDGRSVKMQLPISALGFASGRRGPEDAAWTSTDSLVVQADNSLDVVQTAVQTPAAPVPRSATQLPVLGLELTARSSAADQLNTLRLIHVSSGPQGFASDPHAQVQTAELWVDEDTDGAVTPGDTWVESVAPNATGELLFGAGTPLQIALGVNQAVRVLITLTPHATLVRDGEQLRVRLEQASDIGTAGGLSVELLGPLETSNPPVVDGQAADGYVIVPVAGGVLFSGAKRSVVLDLTVPANGVDADVLQGLRLENAGTATSSDVAKMELLLDDGDGVVNGGDAFVGRLDPISKDVWEVSGVSVALPNDAPQRFLVTIDVAETPAPGATFQARVPVAGVTVFSGNDGPNDVPLSGGTALILSAADRVTWLAGVAGSNSVFPDVETRLVLVFEVFNGYATPRTLRTLTVELTGTADDSEFGNWGLYPDEDQNGLPDASAVAVASPASGHVQFDGIDYTLLPQQQHRLLVTYDAAMGSARDGSRVDAVVREAADIRYSDGGTLSAASFPMDSPGVDTFDGFVRAQLVTHEVASRALGGGETNVLALDVVLPSNGWEADILQSLDLEQVDIDKLAELGTDLAAVRLWRESDLDTEKGSFDAAIDVWVADAVDPAPPSAMLRFSGLSESVPSGGQRFYVTVDVTASPTDGDEVQLRIPMHGVEMASDNDGPIDALVTGSARHAFSSSDLLASVLVSPSFASRSQVVTVSVPVRNQGSTTLSGVIPILVQVVPASAATLVSGPTPASLTLAPSSEDFFSYQFRLDEIGDVRFSAQVALTDSTLPSDVATSVVVRVVDPPSGIDLSLLSNLPPSVNRGQRVTPLIWQLTHPDVDSTSADISVDSVTVRVEDAAGAALLATAVLDDIEIRTGGNVHASWTSVPAASELQIALDPPLVLRGGQTVEMPLAVSIAAQATADAVRFHLADMAAVRATDANSGAPLTLSASLPWSTGTASIHTQATTLAVAAAATLPPATNRGQTGVPAGRFDVSLPGGLNESEARLFQLQLTLLDSIGAAIDPESLLSEVAVLSGTTELLRTSAFQPDGDRLVLPLTIPQLVVSGASETIDLVFDIRSDVSLDRFSVAFTDTSAFVVRDGPSGELVSVQLQSPATFPWTQGPTRVESPAQTVAIAASNLAPASSIPGRTSLRVAALWLSRAAAPIGTADVQVRALAFDPRDDFGNPLVPAAVLTGARVFANGVAAPTTGVPPTTTAPMSLSFTPPLLLSAQDSLQVELELDLSPSLAATQLRFSFEPGAFDMVDANDTSMPVTGTGLPFATNYMSIVAAPNRVAFGPLAEPPANVLRGATAEVLNVRVHHPGAANEGGIEVQRLTFYVRDASGSPLDGSTLFSGATLQSGPASFDGAVLGDSVAFDLTTTAPIMTGAQQDFVLVLNILGSSVVHDFRMELDAASLLAEAGTVSLLATGLDGINLPWTSPSIHIASQNLRASFSSYPNPYSPARDRNCNLTFYLAEDAPVSLEIFTLTGRAVRTLLSGDRLSAGLHDNIAWDGRNGNGEMVRSGTYLMRLTVSGSQGARLVRKLAVIR